MHQNFKKVSKADDASNYINARVAIATILLTTQCNNIELPVLRLIAWGFFAFVPRVLAARDSYSDLYLDCSVENASSKSQKQKQVMHQLQTCN